MPISFSTWIYTFTYTWFSFLMLWFGIHYSTGSHLTNLSIHSNSISVFRNTRELPAIFNVLLTNIWRHRQDFHFIAVRCCIRNFWIDFIRSDQHCPSNSNNENSTMLRKTYAILFILKVSFGLVFQDFYVFVAIFAQKCHMHKVDDILFIWKVRMQ